MTFFTEINLPSYTNLLDSLSTLIDTNVVAWHNNQICLNTTAQFPDNYRIGTGSLDKDWDKASTIIKNGISKISVPNKENTLRETDFTTLCTKFNGTAFEQVYKDITSKFKVGRIRIIMSSPKTCLSWHQDSSIRLHYPIKTQDGCFMVINNEIKHIPLHTWLMADTVELHTAFNASKESRIHLVATILDKNNE